MSPADAVWYHGENPANPMTISAILWFDRPLDVDRLRDLVRERLVGRHPVFAQRVVTSRLPGVPARWQDVELDLDEHLRVVHLPAPGTHADLEAACSAERSAPLDRTRPLWSVTVYQGYRGEGSAIHARLHHAIGDGLALMQLLLGLSDEAGAVAPPVSGEGRWWELGHHALSASSVALHTAAGLVTHPGRAAGSLRHTGEAVAWSARLLAPALAERSVLQGRPGGTKRMAWDPDGLPVADVKTRAREFDATVNDVLLALLAGGLHRYLDARHALVDDVVVMVPVNLRPPGKPLPRHLGNRIGLLPVHLPVRTPDPHRRLRLVQERIGRLKDSPAPGLSRALLVGTSLATPRVERVVHRLNQWCSTGVVTSVPGPTEPLHVAGARIVGTVGWGGMTGHLNLGVAFISLAGRVFPGVVTDVAITPDPDHLLDLVRREWEETLAPGRALVA